MTTMSELAPDGALGAGSLEKWLRRFKDSSEKFGAKFEMPGMNIVQTGVSEFDALRTGKCPRELHS